jgi:hypothetical protein
MRREAWQVQCHELSEDDRDETKRCAGRPRLHEATGDRKGRANRLQAKPPPEHLLMAQNPEAGEITRDDANSAVNEQ